MALSTHAVGETAGVRAAKGKAAQGPENITHREKLSKLEPASTEVAEWEKKRAAVLKILQ